MSAPSTPLPKCSLNHQVVLEEDEYTAALSQIIARDFFPSLVQLDATNNYLETLDSRDPHLSVRRLEEISSTPAAPSSRRPPSQTPTPLGYGPSDTPLRTPRGEAPAKRPKYNTSFSLDEFQARYTSEDNSSFTQILDGENRKRKEKYGWAWEAQKMVEARQGKMVEARERMLIEAPPATGVREQFKIEAPKPAGLLKDGSVEHQQQGEAGEKDEENDEKGKDVILHMSTTGEIEVDVMAPRKDTRPAGVDGWKFKARNSLMFAPDANESPYHPSPGTAEDKSDPKIIKYGNTRLPEQEHSASASQSASTPSSPTRTEGTPTLVPNVPSPTPAELGPAAVKQLMTWGTLGATPRVISNPDGMDVPPPGTPFHLQDISAREAISHKLSNKASKNLRAKAGLLGFGQLGRTPGVATPLGRKGDMGPPSWTPRKSEAAGNLTPAARRLLERTTRTAKRAEVGRVEETDLNKVRWTPTPTSMTRR